MKILLLLWAFLAQAGYVPAMLALTGASCVEELSESELERWQSLSEHPLDLNLASRSRLLSCGLFTPYQVASLMDVRSRSGDILSLTELGLTDGFTPEIADALSHFIVLRSDRAPGSRPQRRVSQSLTLKTAGRSSFSGSPGFNAGLKYEIGIGERAAAYWSTRTAYDDSRLGLGTLSAVYYGRRHLGKLILGNFNARFGQGLAQWSGFDMSSLSSVAAFRKSGGGLSPTGSFSAELCGAAVDMNFARWNVSAAYSFSGNELMANVTRVGRTSCLGLTATRSRASFDWRVGMPDISIFGEVALAYPASSTAERNVSGNASGMSPTLSWKGLAVRTGAIWIPRYGSKFALLARFFDPRWNKDYSGIALGAELPLLTGRSMMGMPLDALLTATIDAGYSLARQQAQLKGVLGLKLDTALGELALHSKLRLQPVLRTMATVADKSTALPSRLDLRADLKKQLGPIFLAGRINTLWCRGFAWLWYLESGLEREKFSAYARAGLFKVDNWDDRIYVYERDAPGSFNVPAIYGRGWNASLYAAWKPSRTHSFWLRLETISYPWNLSPKSPKLELRLQYRLRL